MKRMVAALAASLITLPAFATGWPVTTGEPYAKARGDMIAAGWETPPAARDCGWEWRADVCAAYQETEACSGTGAAYCSFRFVDAGGKVVRIVTTGETVETLVVHDAFAVVED
ncbi:hypothetical protein VQ045_12520 [Aurantimonas sp. E1-2-R+4]|uniref:hypothetical protein n=1 Tax=Aurantimonas sp. E1-2-R+4 TaxID=3113714 RepID=UPI002F9458AA